MPSDPCDKGKGISHGIGIPWLVRWRQTGRLFLLDVLRAMERGLPVRILYWLLCPYALARTFLDHPLPVSSSLYLGAVTTRRATRSRVSHYLDCFLEYFPDRLSTPRWRERCQIVGLHRLREARQRGPVVLAFSHFGPFALTGFWLRAHGIPVTALIFGKAVDRSAMRRRRNCYLPFPAVPSGLYLDQLRDVVRVLSAGGTLLVAIDVKPGRQADVPLGEGWTFRMAAGGIRMAARHDAELIPCNIIREGPWRFRIELGPPVPREHMTGEPQLIAVGKHLLGESVPHWRQYPEQCHPNLPPRFRLDPTGAR